jgi:hypothetical protein
VFRPCKRQGDFTPEPMVTPVKTHLTLEPAIMFSIMRVPNPRCVGGVTAGPPNSIQLTIPSRILPRSRFAIIVLQILARWGSDFVLVSF